MADLNISGGHLHLALTDFEKLESVHGDIEVPLSSVTSIEVVENALDVAHGVRKGTGLPGVMVVGSISGNGTKSFVIVHAKHTRGVRVGLHGEKFDQLVVGNDDPESLAATLAERL